MKLLVVQRSASEDISTQGSTSFKISFREFRDGDKRDGTIAQDNATNQPAIAAGMMGAEQSSVNTRTSFTFPTSDMETGSSFTPGTVWEFVEVADETTTNQE
jgi:hypothetical protein